MTAELHRAGALSGQVVVVTRAKHQAHKLSQLLSTHGAVVVERPLLSMTPPDPADQQALTTCLQKLHQGLYDAVIFTSGNAVEFLEEQIKKLGYVITLLTTTKVFSIGPETVALLRQKGIHAIVALRAISDELFQTLQLHFPKLLGQRFLLLRAKEGRELLHERLKQCGALVDLGIVYQTLVATTADPLPEHVDWITFASPSAVQGFIQTYQRPPPAQAKIACIGPTTAHAARSHGLPVHVVAESSTVEHLVAAMARYLNLGLRKVSQ